MFPLFGHRWSDSGALRLNAQPKRTRTCLRERERVRDFVLDYMGLLNLMMRDGMQEQMLKDLKMIGSQQ